MKLVLMLRADSIYDDEPDVQYDFPRQYLSRIEQARGDWAIYCEPAGAGPRGYFATAKIRDVVAKPGHAGRFLAVIEPGSFLPFDREVPRLVGGRPLESLLAYSDGTPKPGGQAMSAVRRLPDEEFERIVGLGLPADLEAIERRRYDLARSEMDEAQALVGRPVVERLTSRAFREVAFRRKVRAAYRHCCAFSGLQLRNGGGRPEVQAAHIRPVARGGSDSVRNGLALSGTLHWMFDRGLVSVAEDRSILVSHNKVPRDVVDRLIVPDRKLRLPADERDWPHPANLLWHRQNVHGQARQVGRAPWD